MEFDITALTKTYIWNTFSKVSQVNALMQRMNCNQKEGNTETRVREDGSRIVDLYLHGNLICSYDPTYYDNQKVKLYSQNYYTKTTKERLNAILHLHTNGKVRIVQVKGKWLVRDLNTDTEINFYDGMVVFQKPLTLSEIEDRKQLEFSIV
tara:strand:- start:327 stop:779 length:453 start_codon:yes stop_codon:yes gene_type:complete